MSAREPAYRILAAARLAPTIARFVVRAPLVARKREAGQLVIVRVDEAGERIPLTVVDADPARGTITLIVQAVGKTTRQLVQMRAGEALADVLGPLGHPTPIRSYGAVYAIGPLPMMKAVAGVTRERALPTYVSLNALMVDGTGMCGGCRVTEGGETRFACVDGPEFDGHRVDFDELARRNRTYQDRERLSDERFAAACAGRSEVGRGNAVR